MADVIKAPQPWSRQYYRPLIFLSGSIEMGRAEDWQTRVTNALAGHDAIVLNPRRDDWDAGWQQSIIDPRFHEQVTWELAGLEMADLIPVYFAPDTFAPITLLEFGMHARSNRLMVCCPDGFYRKGNIEVVCRRYGVPLVQTLDELIANVQAFIAGWEV